MRFWATEGTLVHAERQAILAALEHTGFNIKRAAERLRISRSTAHRLIAAYEIELDLVRITASPAPQPRD